MLKHEARVENVTGFKVLRQAAADRYDLEVVPPECGGALAGEFQMAFGYIVCDYALSNCSQRNSYAADPATEFKHHSVLDLDKAETCKVTGEIPCFDLSGLPKFRSRFGKLRGQIAVFS